LKRILVPLAGSEVSEGVLTLVTMFVNGNKTEVILLPVVEYPAPLYSDHRDDKTSTNPDLIKTIQNCNFNLWEKLKCSGGIDAIIDRVLNEAKAPEILTHCGTN